MLVISNSFEYLCYGSTATIKTFTLTVRGSTRGSKSESGIYKRQILTSKDGPCTARVNFMFPCTAVQCVLHPEYLTKSDI